jgi:hypothetical protein
MRVVVLTGDGTEVFFETVCRLREVGTGTCMHAMDHLVDPFADPDTLVREKLATAERNSGTHIRNTCTHQWQLTVANSSTFVLCIV